MAIFGILPVNGFRLIDGTFVRALRHGQNRNYQDGIIATAGGTKAAAFQLPAAVALLKVDVCATGNDSVLLPQALAGTEVLVFNNGAATLALYGQGTDTVNQAATATSYTLTAGQAAKFFCATDGKWAAVKTA